MAKISVSTAMTSETFFAHTPSYLAPTGGGEVTVQHTTETHAYEGFKLGVYSSYIGIVGTGLTFTVEPFAITGGTINRYSDQFSGVGPFFSRTAEGLLISATEFLNLVAAENWYGIWKAVTIGDDTIDGGFLGTNSIEGFDGNDVINGNGPPDSLLGGDGDDTLSGSGGDDFLSGGAGADRLQGGDGTDTADYADKSVGVTVFLDGATPATVIVGVAFEDMISEIESVTGGAGADALVGDTFSNVLRGGDGADFLFSHGFNADGTMKTGAGGDTLEGGTGDDGLFAGDGKDALNGGDGSDGMVGGAGDDALDGGAGGDFLFGGGLTATGAFAADSGDDTLNGGDGNDGLWGQDGADTINGGAGDDFVFGGAGSDVVEGGSDNDYLLGEDGDDQIAGGVGFDYSYGGAGADTFVFCKGDSADWILDFNAAQGDKLRLERFAFADLSAVPLVDLSTPGNPAVQLTIVDGANVDQLTIFGVTLAQLNAGNVLVA